MKRKQFERANQILANRLETFLPGLLSLYAATFGWYLVELDVNMKAGVGGYFIGIPLVQIEHCLNTTA